MKPIHAPAFAATLSLAFALAGCPAPMTQPATPGGTTPGGTQPAQPAGGQQATGVAPATQAAGTEDAQAAAEAMGDEQEADDYDYMADAGAAAAYELAQGSQAGDRIRAAAKVRLSADVLAKITARRDALKARLTDRIAARGVEIAKKIKDAIAAAPETTGEDGSKTKTATITGTKTVGKLTADRTMTITRTRNADGALVYSKITGSHTLPNGMSRSFTRERSVDANGVITVTFHRERTGRDGATLVADWEKTIAADGTVSGTGTLTTTKGGVTKTRTVTLAGKEDEPTATVANPDTRGKSDVALDFRGKARAKVTDAAGASADATVEADADVAAAPDAA